MLSKKAHTLVRDKANTSWGRMVVEEQPHCFDWEGILDEPVCVTFKSQVLTYESWVYGVEN